MQKIVKMRLEKKGRKGAGVTVLYDITGVDDLETFGKELKKKMGCGGTVKDATVEIQGEMRERLRTHLAGLGFTVKG